MNEIGDQWGSIGMVIDHGALLSICLKVSGNGDGSALSEWYW
jgi:hypothetical protein